ncbi:o-succinylbenzoate synthase [Vagococcus hydrophili]|uniref:Multifunctional fusion protein n=1 Tax=Vagococcus hydrophili TaxID=2714947 RepID=A0A6G8AWB8_9ENTE|nr:o-succinylbenzoate synthase [Vagococcus hydrophili]QIL49245.1 o-succinylbenzoate synthase [Vagococcus hydrophili]
MLTIKTKFGSYACHYLTKPKKNAKTLVCLHGFMGTHATFDFLKEHSQWNIIGIDLMGHGESELSNNSVDYVLTNMSEALEEVFIKMALTDIYLLGYSFGGRLAQTYAYHYPNRVKHLFLESAGTGLKEEEEKTLRKESDQKLAQKLKHEGMVSFVEMWQNLPLFASQKLISDKKIMAEVTCKKQQNSETMALSLVHGSVAHQLNFLETDLFNTVPTTFIAGSLDEKYTQIGQTLTDLKQVNLVIIKNVGHCAHLEAPEYFFDILHAMIEGKTIQIQNIEAYEHDLELVTPFKTSYGELTRKKTDIFVVTSTGGIQGYGELLSFETPDYIEETLSNDRHLIKTDLVPLIAGQVLYSPRQVRDLFSPVKGNQMAKSAIETAIWDLFAKVNELSLSEYIGLINEEITVGVSLGIQKDEETLLNIVTDYVNQGYSRIKLKISKGKDLSYIKKIREVYPDLTIMVDANSGYHLSDIDLLKQLDNYRLAMIEQPLGASDFYEHSLLQKEINTPICLDENIRSLNDVKLAHSIRSCQSINLKIPRVGGLTEALEILEYAKDNQLSIWLGGMLESGVGRSLNLILANHSAFTLPGDLSASDRYYVEDVITQSFSLNNGKMKASNEVGIGVCLKETRVKKKKYL